MFALIVTVAVFLLMLAESMLSRRNERVLRARGAIEPRDDVYALMTWAYPLSFLAIGVEGAMRGVPRFSFIATGLTIFAVAKALKLWAIWSLGDHWSFRVLVVPGQRLVASGPYQYVRHPNYIAVVGELLGMAVWLAAPFAGVAAIAGFTTLMRRRIAIEERALGLRST
jgi:methyltransferase